MPTSAQGRACSQPLAPGALTSERWALVAGQARSQSSALAALSSLSESPRWSGVLAGAELYPVSLR